MGQHIVYSLTAPGVLTPHCALSLSEEPLISLAAAGREDESPGRGALTGPATSDLGPAAAPEGTGLVGHSSLMLSSSGNLEKLSHSEDERLRTPRAQRESWGWTPGFSPSSAPSWLTAVEWLRQP